MRLFMARLFRRRWAAIGIVLVVFAGICAAAGQTSPQAPAKPSGIVIGRVVDGTTNAPLAGATVTIAGPGVGTLRVIVDPQGRFLFNGLQSGSFAITATRSGYLSGTYGTLRPDGTGRPLILRDAEHITDAVVRLWRYAAINGTVTDDAGDRVPYARVQALRRTIVAGHWRLVNSNQADADDRGVYRMSRLRPGEYALVITSLASSLPASLMQVADALRRMTPAEASGLYRELATNGTSVNDLTQRAPSIRNGDLLVRSSEFYPTVWYPGVATPAEASVVSVGAGEDRMSIDLHPTLARTFRVSGTVAGPNGLVAYLSMRLVPARLDNAAAEITSSLANSLTTSMTSTDADGAFTFVGVPPGQYLIRALTTPRPPEEPPPPAGTPAPAPLVPVDPVLWTETAVSVGSTDTTGVAVSLRPGLRVTGRTEFTGSAPRPSAAELRSIVIVMDSADGRTTALPTGYRAQIDSEGRFYTIGLPAGRYLVRIDRPPRGWTVKAAMVNGRDICDVPIALVNDDVSGLVLTFTDRPATISGAIRDSQGRPDEEAIALIFPADGNWIDQGPNPRRFRGIRADSSGAFSTAGLPPGEYFAVAINDAIASNWQDPAFLQKLARVATRVVLADGQALTLNLTTTEGIAR